MGEAEVVIGLEACPSCHSSGSSSLLAGLPTAGETPRQLRVNYSCVKCHYSWTAIFRFVSFEDKTSPTATWCSTGVILITK